MSSRIRKIQTTFQSGQIDQAAIARNDIALFESALQDARNWRMLSTGGITKRYGTKYIEQNISDRNARLIPFDFDNNEKYIFAVMLGRIQIYRDDVHIGALAITELSSTQIVKNLTWTQSGDFMFLCHKDITMLEIQRTGLNTFVYSAYTVDIDEDGVKEIPFAKFAAANVTLNLQTLDGSGLNFSAVAIGSTFRLTSSAEHFTSAYATNAVQIKMTIRHNNILPITASPTTLWLQISSYIDSTNVEATLLEISPIPTSGNTPPTHDWAEEMMNPIVGYPRAITPHAGRLWLGGFKSYPAHLVSSQVGAFWNLNVGTGLDNEAIVAPINTDRISTIKHLVSGQHLQVFTDYAEFYISEDEGVPITPSTAAIRKSTQYGTDHNAPLVLGDATFFSQRRGTVIREYLWNSLNRGYTSNPVSLLANDVLGNIQSMAIDYGGERGPEQYMYFVNNDGTMGVFHTLRSEEVSGFMPWVTDGNIFSVAVLDEDVYLLVERFIDGSAVYWLEKVERNTYLDAGIRVNNSVPSTLFSGFLPYKSTTVHVTADDEDYYLGEFDVSAAGEIDLEPAGFTATSIRAGLTYTALAETLPVNFTLANGPTDQLPKRIISAFVRFNNSYNFLVDGKKFSPRYTLNDMSDPPQTFSGTKRVFMLGADTDTTVTVETSIPLRCTLTSIGVEVGL